MAIECCMMPGRKRIVPWILIYFEGDAANQILLTDVEHIAGRSEFPCSICWGMVRQGETLQKYYSHWLTSSFHWTFIFFKVLARTRNASLSCHTMAVCHRALAQALHSPQPVLVAPIALWWPWPCRLVFLGCEIIRSVMKPRDYCRRTAISGLKFGTYIFYMAQYTIEIVANQPNNQLRTDWPCPAEGSISMTFNDV